MTIPEFLQKHPTNEAVDILAYLLNSTRTKVILSRKNIEISLAQKAKKMLSAYRSGMPLAYILNHKYFYGLKFIVDKNVLIPRPETEWLVDRALSIARLKLKDRAMRKPIKIIDVGTGSGCISISMARSLNASQRRQVKISAVDISAAALKVAKLNSRLHRASIKFIKSNLLDKARGRYDLIIANLPYIPVKDYQKLKSNLQHEPRMALIDRSGKFDLYRQLFAQLKKHANDKAVVLLEIDPSAKPYLTQYLDTSHVTGLKFSKDYHGLWRYTEFVWHQPKSQWTAPWFRHRALAPAVLALGSLD